MPGTDPFDDPQSDIIEFKSFEDQLTLITPTEAPSELTTVNGTQTVIRANVWLLEGTGPDERTAPAEYRNVTIFGKALVPTFAKNLGKKPVLGVLGKGAAKKGQKPPWVFNEATTEQKKAAKAWYDSQSPFADADAS
jgi:hypothetical protein